MSAGLQTACHGSAFGSASGEPRGNLRDAVRDGLTVLRDERRETIESADRERASAVCVSDRGAQRLRRYAASRAHRAPAGGTKSDGGSGLRLGQCGRNAISVQFVDSGSVNALPPATVTHTRL